MAPGASSTDLPVSLYESVIDMVNLQVDTNFEQYNLSPFIKVDVIGLSRRECYS